MGLIKDLNNIKPDKILHFLLIILGLTLPGIGVLIFEQGNTLTDFNHIGIIFPIIFYSAPIFIVLFMFALIGFENEKTDKGKNIEKSLFFAGLATTYITILITATIITIIEKLSSEITYLQTIMTITLMIFLATIITNYVKNTKNKRKKK